MKFQFDMENVSNGWGNLEVHRLISSWNCKMSRFLSKVCLDFFFFRANVLVLVLTALVDPGRIEVPLHGVDPDEMLSAAKKSTYG